MNILNRLFGLYKLRVFLVAVTLLVIWQIMKYWNEIILEKENDMQTIDYPIEVGVYYEALCPDSKHFINKQLLPLHLKAPYLIGLKLVPYGKATTHINNDGSLSFSCQHGKVECDANIVHACVIDIIKDNALKLNTVSCMITDNRMPLQALFNCLADEDYYKQVKQCFESPHGAELLKVNGEDTDALRPKVSFIPTVTLDGMQNNQGPILRDLFSEVCKALTGRGISPAICNK